MRAILLRMGGKTATGYPVSLYEGDEPDVLARAAAGAPADAADTIPLDLSGAPAPAGIASIDLLKDARTVLAAADGSDNSLRDLGVQLHGVLDRGDVGRRWKAARQAARKAKPNSGVQLRTWLDIRDAELARIPWEVMQDPDGGALLALQPWSSVVRYAADNTPGLDGSDLELRILLVIGCNPADLAIEWITELRSFLAAVCPRRHSVDFEVFEAHSRSRGGQLKGALRAALRDFRPHVLHFVGHGRVLNGEGALDLFDASTGQVVPWEAKEFRTWIEPAPPRVVLLNACRTAAGAAAPDAPIEALASLSTTALAAGAGCVVAMQHDIQGKAAARFAEGFYGALIGLESVDLAVTRGRERITDETGFGERNWALPVCTLSVPPDQLLPQFTGIPLERREAVRAQTEAALLAFVDRRGERRALLTPGSGAPGTHVSFVVGDLEMGKSSLVQLLVEWRTLLDHQVILVDCSTAPTPTLGALDLLRHIRGPRTPSPSPRRPHVYASFADFNDTVNAVLVDKPVGAVPATGIDSEQPLDRNRLKERAWETVCGAFLQGLREASKDRPLTIVIDHLSKNNRGVVFEDFREHIVPGILLPIHSGGLPNVSVTIVATEKEVDSCGLTALRDATRIIARLADFPFEDWELLAREFAVRLKLNEQVAEEAIGYYARFLRQKAWKPRSLLNLKRAYDDAMQAG